MSPTYLFSNQYFVVDRKLINILDAGAGKSPHGFYNIVV